MSIATKFSTREIERISGVWGSFDVPVEFADAAAYSRVYQRSFEYHLKRVAMLGVEGESAIDVGCGCGQWSFALASKFDRVTGIDMTTPRIDLSTYLGRRFEIDRVNFRETGAIPLDFSAASHDFIFCYSVLLSILSLPGCLNEFYRVLKPGGQFYISLNGPGWARYLRDGRGAANARDRANGIDTYYNSICQYRLGPAEQTFRQLRVELATQRDRFDGYCADAGGDSQRARLALAQVRSAQRVEQAFVSDTGREFVSAIGKPPASAYDSIENIEHLLAALSAPLDLQGAAKEIEKECGSDRLQIFLNDLILILSGRPYTFSNARSGRIYYVDEVRKAVEAAGFETFVYADEGCLQMDPAAENVEPIYPKVADDLKVWDFMARKPVS